MNWQRRKFPSYPRFSTFFGRWKREKLLSISFLSEFWGAGNRKECERDERISNWFLPQLASGSKKKSSSKIGFIKAKKNLRALFGGKRSESGEIYVDDKDSIREMRSRLDQFFNAFLTVFLEISLYLFQYSWIGSSGGSISLPEGISTPSCRTMCHLCQSTLGNTRPGTQMHQSVKNPLDWSLIFVFQNARCPFTRIVRPLPLPFPVCHHLHWDLPLEVVSGWKIGTRIIRIQSESSRRPWDLSARRNEKRTSSPLASTSPFTSLHAKFNLTKTKQQVTSFYQIFFNALLFVQIDPSDDVVTSSDDLRSLSLFIFKKQSELSAEKTKRDTVVDALFKKALKELHMELIGYEAVFDVSETT